ncbi:MAG: family peptidase, partial [Verrucomicrobiaceae bacterium]|nr:family peptidase [Verrucomicrobiaceae bacterium]
MRKIGFACLSFFIFHAAANATPPIDAYGHLPSIELMQLAPSGQRYAFVAVVNESRKLIVLSDKGAAIYVVGIGDNKVRNLQWVGDDRLLLWTSSTFDNRLDLVQAHEFVSVINIDLKASKTSNVFDGTQQAAKIVFGSAGTAQINGHCYAYFVGIGYEWDRGAAASPSRGSYVFNGDHRNLYRVDLENGDVSMLARGGDGPGFEWVIGADGNVLAHSQYDADAGVWRLFAGTDRSKPLLERKSRFDDINLLGRGRTADTVWIADHSSNSLIEEVSIPDGKRETVFGDVRFDRYLTDPDSGLAIGAITNAESGASLFEPKLQARIKGTRKAFPDSRMQLISYSRNMDRLIVKTDAGDDSGTYWLVDIASGNANPLGYPYPEVRAADMGIAKWISYKAADGMDIEAVLTLPPARKAERLPLVVLPHGGPIG